MDDRAAGLRFGAGSIDGGYGVASIVALHAADFRSALAALSRYKRLTCPEIVDVQSRGDEVVVRYCWLEAEGEVPRLLVDTAMASLHELALRGTGGRVQPVRLELARRAANMDLLRRHFNCEVVFGAVHDAMVFERAALDVAFMGSDGGAFVTVLEKIEERLGDRDTCAGLDCQVRVAIARLSIGFGPGPRIGFQKGPPART